MTAVRLRDLCKRYSVGGGYVDALRGVSLDIVSGESLAVVGPSGCGKSTLLALVAGLDTPTRGSVEIGGKEIGSLDDAERTRFRRETVGLVFQSADLLPFLTAVENVDLLLAMRGRSDPEAARMLLVALGLEGHTEKLPDQLSGGQRQRVAIARAVVHEPQLILADEPTGKLDRAAASATMDLLQKVQRERGATLVVVSHDAEIAGRLDRVLHLRDGAVADSERPAVHGGANASA